VELGQRALAHVGVDADFWRARRVLVTGHTGFKGSWLTLWLAQMGAEVAGLSNGVPTSSSLYEEARVGDLVAEIEADVRDHHGVRAALGAHRPAIVFHLAAQAIVRRSFRDPRETYETNVMGTVNVLEAVRQVGGVGAVVIVTSDKAYDNREHGRPFVEDDPKGGHDPYSSSKGCAELVADAYTRSFFAPHPDGPRLGCVRAGNVIGGGDWGEDRLIPDIMRAAAAGTVIRIRNPDAVRPWQHVLNPLSGYLQLAQALIASPAAAGGWNFGPAADDVRPVSWLTRRLTELWPGELRWQTDPGPHPHEARFLALDSTKAREQLGWAPAWGLDEALRSIVGWYAALQAGRDMRGVTLEQIEAFRAHPTTLRQA
jgi:CDP-glucose 4,6-dehydratase